MRSDLTALATSLVTLILAAPAFPQFKPTINVNCTRGESLAAAVALALPNTLINVKGTCPGPILITTFGHIVCDSTSLIRGPGSLTCPH